MSEKNKTPQSEQVAYRITELYTLQSCTDPGSSMRRNGFGVKYDLERARDGIIVTYPGATRRVLVPWANVSDIVEVADVSEVAKPVVAA